MEAKHTGTPWFVYSQNRCLVVTATNEVVIDAGSKELSVEECRDNAAFIVRAVNAHDDLVKALQEIVTLADYSYVLGSAEHRRLTLQRICKAAQDALAKAGA